MERTSYRPGDLAPNSGVYRVVHHAHRLPHDVTIERETVLPECARCGDHVRFAYLEPAAFVRDDYDFRPPQKRAANGS
jgi:hypothetical protein